MLIYSGSERKEKEIISIVINVITDSMINAGKGYGCKIYKNGHSDYEIELLEIKGICSSFSLSP